MPFAVHKQANAIHKREKQDKRVSAGDEKSFQCFALAKQIVKIIFTVDLGLITHYEYNLAAFGPHYQFVTQGFSCPSPVQHLASANRITSFHGVVHRLLIDAIKKFAYRKL